MQSATLKTKINTTQVFVFLYSSSPCIVFHLQTQDSKGHSVGQSVQCIIHSYKKTQKAMSQSASVTPL